MEDLGQFKRLIGEGPSCILWYVTYHSVSFGQVTPGYFWRSYFLLSAAKIFSTR